ncbi:hypothetical protein BSKO_13928 [Bryopsis sp. KO-2023]|nr:hypothetical protein BSKO_13928 [Bryopsis sp. KO-2023]
MSRGASGKRRSEASRRNDAYWTVAAAALGLFLIHYLWWSSLWAWEERSPSATSPSESGEVLRVPITFNGERLVLELRKGQEISETVEEFILSHNIPGDQFQHVSDSLRIQAWSLGFIDRTGVSVVDHTTGEPVNVELSQGDDVEARLRETGRMNGVADDLLEPFVESAMLSLIKERVLPLFAVDVEFKGIKGQVRYFQGDRLEEVVQSFCKLHDLKGKAVRSIGNAVHAEAIRRRVIPSLSLHLNVQEQRTGEMSPVQLEVFYGDDLGETLEKFGKKYRLTGEATDAIKAALVRQSVLKRIMPLLRVPMLEVQQMGSQPRTEMWSKVHRKPKKTPPPSKFYSQPSENLTLYAGDDFSVEVTNFLHFHGLTFGARPKLIARAEKAAVVNGVKPIASIRIDLWRYDKRVKEGSRAVMPIYHGMPLVESIASLGETYRLSTAAQKKILTDVRKVMGKHKGKSVAVLELAYQRQGQVIPMVISVREGFSIDEIAEEAADKAGVLPEDSVMVYDGIVQEAAKLRVLPALSFKVNGPDGWAPLNIFAGDNMSAVVEHFVEDMGVRDKHDLVFCEVVKSAIRRQLIPAASAEVKVLDPGWLGPEIMYVDLHDGDDVSAAVESMGMYYDLKPSHKDVIAREVQRSLDAQLIRVPGETVLVSLGGINVSFPIFEGEDWRFVIERAKEYPVWGDPLSEAEGKLLEETARHLFAEVGVAPVLEFMVKVKHRGELRFSMYRDETMAEATERFIKMHGLSEAQSHKIKNLVRRKAVSNRLLPAFSVNVTIPGGRTPLRFFAGDNLNSTVEVFGKLHGFSDKRINRLTRDALVRAGKARVLPVLVFNYTVDGDMHTIKLFQGDKIRDVVGRLAAKQKNLNADRLKEIAMARAQELRLIPLQTVPVMVMSGVGIEEVSIDVFRGDNVDLLAREFVSTRGLSLDADLLANIVKSQLSGGNG